MKRRELEDFEQSCEFRHQPPRTFKPFAVDIYQSEDIKQTVFCYVTDSDNDRADVEILMPIFIQPQSIREDVDSILWAEYQLSLGSLVQRKNESKVFEYS